MNAGELKQHLSGFTDDAPVVLAIWNNKTQETLLQDLIIACNVDVQKRRNEVWLAEGECAPRPPY